MQGNISTNDEEFMSIVEAKQALLETATTRKTIGAP